MTTEAAAFAALRRSAGLCPDCNEPRGERSRCPKHLTLHAERTREVRAAQVAREAAVAARKAHRREWYREWQRARRAARRLSLLAVEEMSR